MVSTVRLDAAALGTLVNHLTRLELEALDELLGGISFWNGSLESVQRYAELHLTRPDQISHHIERIAVVIAQN